MVTLPLPLPPPPSPSNQSSHPLTSLVHNVLAYDGNIMLAAIISLLLVILFVLLLHIYAKWFLGRAQANRRIHRRSVSVPGILGSRFHHFHTYTIDTTYSSSDSPTKGLEPSIISSLPLFVYKENECNRHGVECVICLTVFEEEEVGRKIPKCGHVFHVECIDMWLHSHATCPICRAAVIGDDGKIAEFENDQREDPVVEIIVEEVPSPEIYEDLVVRESSLSDATTSLSLSLAIQTTSLGESLKKIMSRNRSEHKVDTSDNVKEVETST